MSRILCGIGKTEGKNEKVTVQTGDWIAKNKSKNRKGDYE